MTARYPLLYRGLCALALATILLAALWPGVWRGWEIAPALALIVLIGIPHGATDHLIFRHLRRGRWDSFAKLKFYAFYLLLMAAYGMLWYLAPIWAFGLFLCLSMYHFGQSNWNYLEGLSRWRATLLYSGWGAFAILTPVLIHYEEAAGIIGAITRAPAPILDPFWQWSIPGLLLVCNLAAALALWVEKIMDREELAREVVNLLALAGLFWSAPLLLGFAIYFAGWHSLGSMMDQIEFFRQRNPRFTWRDYLRNSFPLSALAIGGGGGALLVAAWLGVAINTGALFIFIAVITLPHMLLIEQLYAAWLPQREDNSSAK
jgi:Brp/Blh family beta-carotene 15,15'-monooxygenase